MGSWTGYSVSTFWILRFYNDIVGAQEIITLPP